MKRVFLFVILFLIFLPEGSYSLPRFALMTGAKCGSCHVNPTGGQMRNEYGISFSMDKLPLEALKDSEFTFSGKLNENISIGGDYRSQFMYDNGSRKTTFQAMTTSIYGAIKLNTKYTFYFKQDIVNNYYGPWGGPEVFAVAKILPGGWYIKGGVFLPEYGVRLDDHTTFTRGGNLGTIASLGLNIHTGLIFTPNYKDIGLEVGGYIGGLALTVGGFNGNGDQAPLGFSNRKAIAGKAEYMGSFSDLNFRIGASAYSYDVMSMEGANAGIGNSCFQLHGEIDWANNYHSNSFEPLDKALAAYAELDVKPMQVIWVTGKFDMFDPAQGASDNELKRVTLGFEFFPYSFVEVRPQYRISIETPSVDNDVALVQMHVWF